MIRRRRECLECSRRYTTYERVEEIPLRVVKKDGTRAAFERRKIVDGMTKACEKRPVSSEAIEQVVQQVERKLADVADREVTSHAIGEMVMGELRTIDQVAYVRFASVYRQFKDIRHFMRELRDLIGIELPDVRQLQRGMDRPPRQRGTGERQRTLDLESGEEPPKKDRSG